MKNWNWGGELMKEDFSREDHQAKLGRLRGSHGIYSTCNIVSMKTLR